MTKVWKTAADEKNAEACPCVRPARKGKPTRGFPPVRIGWPVSRPNLGFILLRADESSLHVDSAPPRVAPFITPLSQESVTNITLKIEWQLSNTEELVIMITDGCVSPEDRYGKYHRHSANLSSFSTVYDLSENLKNASG